MSSNASRRAGGLPWQRRPNMHVNRASAFFFAQLDKLLASSVAYVFMGCFVAYMGLRAMFQYIDQPAMRRLRARPRSMVPMTDEHNARWGLLVEGNRTTPMTHDAAQRAAGQHEAPVSRRARLVYAEASELRGQDVVCMEVAEYDAQKRRDVYYRSVSYVHTDDTDKSTGRGYGKGSSSDDNAVATRRRWWRWRRGDGDATSDKAGVGTHGDGGAAVDYRTYMPHAGTRVLHGMVQCADVTDDNNCIPAANHLQDELSRKLMLTLGPVHMLRNQMRSMLPLRMNRYKEQPLRALVVGLHSGELPAWLSRIYNNFHVDVVEADGALARVCRRFLGFRETSNLALYVTDPIEYVRHTAARMTIRKATNTQLASVVGNNRRHSDLYDLVLLQPIDGDGKLSVAYGKLDFIMSVRGVMGPSGCVALVLPNRDASFVHTMVQNWRIGFSDSAVLLVHCTTAPYTILMTFQDQLELSDANFGTLDNVAELQDLERAHMSHYGVDKVPFDLPNEVHKDNCRMLMPGHSYNLDAYLPRNHPAVRASTRRQAQAAAATASTATDVTGKQTAASVS